MIKIKSLLGMLAGMRKFEAAAFNACMEKHRDPKDEVCPVCGKEGHCKVHAYYERTLICCQQGKKARIRVRIQRVICTNCKHTHAILPDVLIPYDMHSLIFIIEVLSNYFHHKDTVERICEKYLITRNQLYKWVMLWRIHKKKWLDAMSENLSSDAAFIDFLYSIPYFSVFTAAFSREFSVAFLQSHKNPAQHIRQALT